MVWEHFSSEGADTSAINGHSSVGFYCNSGVLPMHLLKFELEVKPFRTVTVY